MYQLINAGIEAYDVFTKSNRFCCVLVKAKKGWKLYWDSHCSRGSQRFFDSASGAIEFMHQRRIKKGWSVG